MGSQHQDRSHLSIFENPTHFLKEKKKYIKHKISRGKSEEC